jgi:hypothetical protein
VSNRLNAGVGFLGAVVALAFNASPAEAWGATGHRIICQIAYLELKPEAKGRVDTLVAIDPRFRTFPDACTGADKLPRVAPQSITSIFLGVPLAFRIALALKLTDAW